MQDLSLCWSLFCGQCVVDNDVAVDRQKYLTNRQIKCVECAFSQLYCLKCLFKFINFSRSNLSEGDVFCEHCVVVNSCYTAAFLYNAVNCAASAWSCNSETEGYRPMKFKIGVQLCLHWLPIIAPVGWCT